MSIEMKKCRKCGNEKEQTKEHFVYRASPTGGWWEGNCRECQNIMRRKNQATKKGKSYSPQKPKEYKSMNYKTIKSSTNTDFKIERNIYMFSDKDIEIIKKVIEKYPDIEKLLENKITLEHTIKNKRLPKSLNIEENIFNKLKAKSEKTGISISDIVNTILRKNIDFID